MKFKNILFLSIFLIFSCNTIDKNKVLAIFKYNQASGIGSLDPIYAKDQATIWVSNQIFNGLVQLNNNLEVIPCIAKKWNISKDGKLYTFYLRDDVYFHEHKLLNKRKVIASDFTYSFNRLKDKKLASPGSWVLSNIEKYNAINDTTFEIALKNPFPPFIGILSMQYCSVVPIEVVENSNFREDPIGTGPFLFQYWKENVKLILRKNYNYFENDGNNQLPYLDGIAISFIKDKQIAFLEFLKGNLDFISGIDGSYKDEVLTRDGNLKEEYTDKIVLSKKPYLNTEYLGFLMDEPLPIEIRMAINLGFDRVKMIKYLRNNIGIPALQGFIPVGMPAFSETLKGYKYNPEIAKKLIKNSDFDTNKEITLSTTSSYLDLCEFIQYSLNEIGLNISIEINPPSTHRQMVATSKLKFFRGSWIADYADAENYLSLFYSKNFCPNGPNYTHFKDDEFDNLYKHAMKQTDQKERYKIYEKMDSLIIKNAVIVPLYYDRVLHFKQQNIINLDINPMNLIELKKVKKN